MRTQSRPRWFGSFVLELIHQIITLKKAGLSHVDIKRLFGRKPISLAALPSAPRARRCDQANQVAGVICLFDTAFGNAGQLG